jgi:hypothetical protein
LSAIAESGTERISQHLSTPVLDLCVSGGHATIVTDGGSQAWLISRWTSEAWTTVEQVPTESDNLIAFGCAADSITLLTSKRMIEIGKDRQLHAVQLKGKLSVGTVTDIYRAGDDIFVGVDAGEWGGGLRRISEKTGEIAVIEQNESGKLCGGLLNSACDPVNGIAAEPWDTDCFVVAVGLVHMLMKGGIVEVCGKDVRPLYTKTYVSNRWGNLPKGRKPPPETVAFFGITSGAGALWAVGIDGLYEIDRSGKAVITPLPHFKTVGDIQVSFGHPDLILVMTDVNQRHSLSGSVPMLVPR